MIKSFRCKDTEKLFNDIDVRRFRGFSRAAGMKLEVLNATVSVRSLGVPPGNGLEQLPGDRMGMYCIRMNGQWRICFFWKKGNANEVEIVDYH